MPSEGLSFFNIIRNDCLPFQVVKQQLSSCGIKRKFGLGPACGYVQGARPYCRYMHAKHFPQYCIRFHVKHPAAHYDNTSASSPRVVANMNFDIPHFV